MTGPPPATLRRARRPSTGLAAGLLLLAGCGGSAAPWEAETAPTRYALVIDAGSTGSRAHLYRWWLDDGTAERIEPLLDSDDEPWTLEVRPALHTFAADPEVGAERLIALLEAAAARLGGTEAARGVPLWLLATAGVRGLGEADRARLLVAVDGRLAAGPFDLRAARTLSGEEEAAYAWVAVNLHAGRLAASGAGAGRPTLGALDLGGASTQVTFEPLDPRTGAFEVPFDPPRQLFTRSFQDLGHDRARVAVDSPDCFPPGFPLSGNRVGRGVWQRCGEAIRSFLAASQPLDPADPDLLPGVPPLEGELVGISVYRYTAAFFGLGPRLVPAQLEQRGRRHCATPWLTLQAEHGDDPYLETRCFAAAYIVTLLTDGYGLAADDDRVRIPEDDPGWALGAAAVGLVAPTAEAAP